MQTLAFLSQKGGSGKTTLAVHTAVAAQEDGERVVIVDTDLQKSATTWSDSRQSDTPVVAPVAAAVLNNVMKASRDDAMTLCIIDTAPHAAPDAARVAALADLVVIPCRPTAFDLAAAGSAVEIVKAAGARAVFVLFRLSAKGIGDHRNPRGARRLRVPGCSGAHLRAAGFRARCCKRQGSYRV